MTTDVIGHSAVAPALHGRTRRLFAFVKDILVGSLLVTNPLTSVLVLGWLLRHMRWVMRLEESRPTWLLGNGSGFLVRTVGGLWANLYWGMAVALALLCATLPFTGLMTLAWWAGWENSFNKGYEQALAGPLLSFLGIALLLPVLCYLPIAISHVAFEQRWSAFFAVRRIRQLMKAAGWRLPTLMVVTAVLSVPLMLFRMSPTFIEEIVPGIADWQQEDSAKVATGMALAYAMYVFASLWLLRAWAARIYLQSSKLQNARPHILLRLVYSVVMLTAAFAVVAQIYVAQFLNHAWEAWLSHPYFLLPWAI